MPKIKVKSTHRHIRRNGEYHEKARPRTDRVHRLNRHRSRTNPVEGQHGNCQSGHVSGGLLRYPLSSPLPLGHSPYDIIVPFELRFRGTIVLPFQSSSTITERRGAA